jgi:hypothetical protein
MNRLRSVEANPITGNCAKQSLCDVVLSHICGEMSRPGVFD